MILVPSFIQLHLKKHSGELRCFANYNKALPRTWFSEPLKKRDCFYEQIARAMFHLSFSCLVERFISEASYNSILIETD